MKIRINLTEAKQAVDPKKAAAAKAADKKAEAKKKEADKKKEAAKKKLKESLYPVVRKMLAENADMEECSNMEETKQLDENAAEIMSQLQNFLSTTIGQGENAASIGSVLGGLAAVGVSASVINKLHQWWEKKHPESFKKAQQITRDMNDITGANK